MVPCTMEIHFPDRPAFELKLLVGTYYFNPDLKDVQRLRFLIEQNHFFVRIYLGILQNVPHPWSSLI